MHTDFTRYVVVNPIYVATSAKTLLRQCHAYGPRAFAVAAATVWNRLPADIRTSMCTVQTFAQKLKTFYASGRISGFFILRSRNWLIIIIIIIIIVMLLLDILIGCSRTYRMQERTNEVQHLSSKYT